MYTKEQLHKDLLKDLRVHDYSYMYSESEEVWLKAKQTRFDIQFRILNLVIMHNYNREHLLNECLGLFTPQYLEGLAHREINKFFNILNQ
jgi:hypothetical protein